MHLTRRQKEILDYVEHHIDEKGYAPTIDEIAEDLPELTTDAVAGAVAALAGAGLLHVNSTDHHLWPLANGRRALARKAG